MSREYYDIVVVGGGPGGSSAAYTLARAGRSVCLIDKAEFPREKLCGGLVTLRSKRMFETIFGQPWEAKLFNSSRNISFFADGKFLASQNGYSQLYFTMRLDFDNYLLRAAENAGTHLKLGKSIRAIDLTRNSLELESGENVSFKFLIGADGVNSLVAKTLFGRSFNPSTIGFGLEVEVPRERLPRQADTVEIDFGAAQWGYGWVFPKQTTFTIGVGGIHSLNPDLRLRLHKYIERKGLDSNEFKVKGQYIPFGDFRSFPGKENVLLCGDAAGTVDPITGEGIAYAMQTGAAAGCAILSTQSGSARERALEIYLRDYAMVTASLRQANLWRRLIFPSSSRKIFAWAFADAGTLQRGYLDILAGDRDYNALYGLFAVQVRKAITKPVRVIWHMLSGRSSGTL